MRRIEAKGRVYFWQGGSLWIGRGHGRSEWHAHHALQIALALSGVCRFRSDKSAEWSDYKGALVRSDRHHEFEIDGATVAHVFVEPETVEGRALNERFAKGDIVSLPEPERQTMADLLLRAYEAGCEDNEVISVAKAALATLTAGLLSSTSVDTRVIKAIEHMKASIAAPVSLPAVASAVALSPGRFRHLFVQETGTAFRVYLLWLRLNLAIEASMAGQSWTVAAQNAGFSDSAHLTRTFKRMFGISPASLVRQ
jgi:AraC family transcriptional regulator